MAENIERKTATKAKTTDLENIYNKITSMLPQSIKKLIIFSEYKFLIIPKLSTLKIISPIDLFSKNL